MSFTPGPWYVVGPPWGDGSYVVAGDRDPHGAPFVCDLKPEMDEWDAPERDILADAHLIASAPDLARALDDLVACAEMLDEFGDPASHDYRDYWLSLERAREALRKAEGKWVRP